MPFDTKMTGGQFKPIYESVCPPGAYHQIMRHPSGKDAAVHIAIVQDHRFAFYYWLEWLLDLKKKHGETCNSPALVSLDWHQDLCVPGKIECQALEELDLTNPNEVALFCWGKLHPNNDGHILAAAYLNIIGDIFIVCKQEGSWVKRFTDRFGNTHSIQCHKYAAELSQELLKSTKLERAIFDIDLDYFTESKEPCGAGKDPTLVPEEWIRNLFDTRSDLMRWIFARFVGMTIATEPKFCGGLKNSNRILDIIDDTLFCPPLLTQDCGWRHLSVPGAEGVRNE